MSLKKTRIVATWPTRTSASTSVPSTRTACSQRRSDSGTLEVHQVLSLACGRRLQREPEAHPFVDLAHGLGRHRRQLVGAGAKDFLDVVGLRLELARALSRLGEVG